MVAISVGLAMGLIALGVLGILGAGVNSLIQGKQDLKRIGMMAVPFIVFGASYLVFSEVPKAGVFTAAFMLGVMALTIVFTGLRGVFKF